MTGVVRKKTKCKFQKCNGVCVDVDVDDYVISREPGPALRMFSATFFSLVFLGTLGHRKFVMTTPNSGRHGARNPLFGPEMKTNQICSHCGGQT